MRRQNRPVAIRRLPQRMDRSNRRTFYRDLEQCIHHVDRPSLVLDCSMLEVLDRHALQAMLCCLEEAMKRNGDVRLAALRPEWASTLHATGLDSLFEMFPTVQQAVESFQNPRLSIARPDSLVSSDESLETNAA